MENRSEEKERSNRMKMMAALLEAALGWRVQTVTKEHNPKTGRMIRTKVVSKRNPPDRWAMEKYLEMASGEDLKEEDKEELMRRFHQSMGRQEAGV